jgi:hypothetical protein
MSSSKKLKYAWTEIRSRLRSLDGFESVYSKDEGKRIGEIEYTRPAEMREN